ncbi:MAG: hypothetical protein M3R46_11900, partial [Actinomycetota bacterium]|nr:hypothetical protein [Actinomycetota bacterium]
VLPSSKRKSRRFAIRHVDRFARHLCPQGRSDHRESVALTATIGHVAGERANRRAIARFADLALSVLAREATTHAVRL